MTFERAFGVAAGVLVIVGLVLAFVVIGPPSHARVVELDVSRAKDLQIIASHIMDRYQAENALPPELPGSFVLRDPVTHRPYEYAKLGAKRYRLCATFSQPAETSNESRRFDAAAWPHGAGRTCYEFSASSDTYLPVTH